MQQPDKSEHWGTIIADWQTSRLTQRQYCLERGLSYSTFCYWRRGVRGKSESESSNAEIRAVEVAHLPLASRTFDPLQTMTMELETQGIVLSIPGSNGTVTVEGRLQLGILAQILAACKGGIGHAQT